MLGSGGGVVVNGSATPPAPFPENLNIINSHSNVTENKP